MDSPVQYLASQERPEPKPSTKARALSDEECLKLIAATRLGLRDFVCSRLTAYDCPRVSASVADVDLEGGTLTVVAQLDRWKEGQAPKLKGLKTDNGYRTIDLHPALVSVLRERRKDALANGLHRDDSFVFSTEDGRPLTSEYRQGHRGGGYQGRSERGRATASLPAHAPPHLRLPADSARAGRGRGGPQLGDKPDTLLRVYAQAFTDSRRRDEIRELIPPGHQHWLGR